MRLDKILENPNYLLISRILSSIILGTGQTKTKSPRYYYIGQMLDFIHFVPCKYIVAYFLVIFKPGKENC
nr:MAG TPA: hypothetical protein [Caudoviricetes sp.]